MLDHRRPRPTVLLGACLIGATIFGALTSACAANAGVATPTPTATAAISGTITVNRPTPPPTLTPPPSTTPHLNVETATTSEMRAAFAAAGILGAAEWAAAIEDGRPYAADDASFTRVRAALAKAGASSATIEKIMPLLTR